MVENTGYKVAMLMDGAFTPQQMIAPSTILNTNYPLCSTIQRQNQREEDRTGTPYDERGLRFLEDLDGFWMDLNHFSVPGEQQIRDSAYAMLKLWGRMNDADKVIPNSAKQ